MFSHTAILEIRNYIQLEIFVKYVILWIIFIIILTISYKFIFILFILIGFSHYFSMFNQLYNAQIYVLTHESVGMCINMFQICLCSNLHFIIQK